MSVYAVGKIQRKEFADVLFTMKGHALRCFSVAELLKGGEERPVVDLIVLCQSWNGQYSQQSIESLRAMYPITPIVCVLGEYCESEGRTGSPLLGINRIYWNQWADVAKHEISAIMGGRLSDWTLPVTTSQEERFMSNNNTND